MWITHSMLYRWYGLFLEPLIVKVVVSKNIYFFIRAGYQILFCT